MLSIDLFTYLSAYLYSCMPMYVYVCTELEEKRAVSGGRKAEQRYIGRCGGAHPRDRPRTSAASETAFFTQNPVICMYACMYVYVYVYVYVYLYSISIRWARLYLFYDILICIPSRRVCVSVIKFTIFYSSGHPAAYLRALSVWRGGVLQPSLV